MPLGGQYQQFKKKTKSKKYRPSYFINVSLIFTIYLFQMFAAIATYLMIFIQFMPKTDVW